MKNYVSLWDLLPAWQAFEREGKGGFGRET